MSFQSTSIQNTHNVHACTLSYSSNPLSIQRGGVYDFSTRVSLGANPCDGLFEKVSDLCMNQWLKMKIFIRSLFILPSTPRSDIEVLSREMARFKARIEQCPANSYDMKVHLERDLHALPADIRDHFANLSNALANFSRETDSDKAEKIKRRALIETNYILNLYPKMHFITGVRTRNNSGPVPRPNPVPRNPFAGTPFANRRARIAPQANEPNELAIGNITNLQRQRGRENAAMKFFIPPNYCAPGDTENLEDKYVCAIKQVEGPLDMPVFHDQSRQADHHFEIDSMQAILANRPQSRKCAVCRTALNARTVYLDIAMQKEISGKLITAVDAIADADIAIRLPQIVNELARESITLPDGTTRNRTQDEAKAHLVAKILELPETANGRPLFSRYANMYMQHVHAVSSHVQ